MHLKPIVFVMMCLLWHRFSAQGNIETEVPPPDHIKSVVFKGSTSEDQFPIVKLGTPVFLSFDDLYADEADYYYKIIHCNYDWTPSDLLKSQYIKGLDHQRILSYKNSMTTLQPYSNYQLQLPNSQTQLQLSGNYILKIFDAYDALVFSRRFIVYKEIVPVGVTIKRSRTLNQINEKQVVQFVINTGGAKIINPQQEIKIAILQNYYWKGAIMNIFPQYVSGNQLIYNYNTETSFNGGNEFLSFDTKEIRVANNSIARVQLEDIYHHYLFTDHDRSAMPYTYNPDINGDFVIRTLNGNNSTEAAYSDIHFSVLYTDAIGLHEVYVFGKFNNYELTAQNKLVYNKNSGNLEASLLLKQGFYNYKYVLVDPDGNIDYTGICGNYSSTENIYTVVVYYRDFGTLYDSVIGIGSANSMTISN